MKTLVTTLILLPKILFAQDFYSETTIYEYDDFNRLIHVVFEDGREYIYTYDELGNREELTVTSPYVEPPIEDVFPDDVFLSADIVAVGESFVISMNQEYVGSVLSSDLADLRMIFFISEDCFLDADDIPIHDVMSNLGSDIWYSTEWTEYTIPADFDWGPYYILSKADYNNVIDEEDEDNNILCVEILITSPANLDEIGNNSFSIYPNPSNDKITVTHSLNEPITLNLYDLNGRLVISQILNVAMIDIDISYLEAGIYHATMVGTNVTETKKIIKI